MTLTGPVEARRYAHEVLRDVVFGLLMAGSGAWGLYRILAPARAIWHGDKSRVPTMPRIQPSVRTYPAFLLWRVPLFGGLALTGLATLLDATTPGRIAIVLARPASFSFSLIVLGSPGSDRDTIADCIAGSPGRQALPCWGRTTLAATSGDTGRVVGYASFAFTTHPAGGPVT